MHYALFVKLVVELDPDDLLVHMILGEEARDSRRQGCAGGIIAATGTRVIPIALFTLPKSAQRYSSFIVTLVTEAKPNTSPIPVSTPPPRTQPVLVVLKLPVAHLRLPEKVQLGCSLKQSSDGQAEKGRFLRIWRLGFRKP